MTEQKLFYTVCATLLMYGLGSYMQLGSFVLPLPFFESGLLLICVFLAYIAWSESKFLSIAFILFGIFQFLGLTYNYNFFLSDEQLSRLSNSLVTDVFKILSHFTLLLILFLQNKRSIFIANKLELSLYMAILVICLFLPTELWILIPILFILFKLVKKDILWRSTGSFWLYIPLFILCRELSLYFLR